MHKNYLSFRSRKPAGRRTLLFGLVALACSVAAVATILFRTTRHDHLSEWREGLELSAPDARWPEWDSSWSPLPLRKNAPEPVVSAVRGASAFAARNAEVMRYIPCYCGACPISHQSNLSCYVRNFQQDGTPVWTDHAWSCPICVNVTREVMLMVKQDKSLSIIRQTLDREYAQAGHRPTSTPPPPQPR